jgi:hypothetical protein
MIVEHGKIEGNLEVGDGFILHGMVTGTITVLDGGVLELHGTCGRDLILEEGATAFLRGTVSGDVRNRGGRLEVYGAIYGRLYKVAGETVVDHNAIVKRGVV